MLSPDCIFNSLYFLSECSNSIFGYKFIDSMNRKERFYLDNDIEVICIQNKNFKKSEITIIVDAGSNYDPKSHQGLAHLVEHMILNSTRKYSDIGIMNYVCSLSGKINAFTSPEIVQFNVSIGDKMLSKISHMLATAFTDLSFDKNSIENEIEIIEREYIKLKSELQKNLWLKFYNKLNSDYPENSFIPGNRKSLKHDDIAEQLNSFAKNYYTGNRIKIVIASKINLKKIIKIADSFKIISKGKLKNGFSSRKEKGNEIKFNDKYEIKTLNVPIEKIELKTENAGSIIKFYSKENTNNVVLVYIPIPWKFSFFEYKFSTYLKHAIENDFDCLVEKIFGNFAIKSHNISFEITINKRISILLLKINCENTSENNLTAVLEQLHVFFYFLTPNSDFAKFFRHHTKNNFLEPNNETEIVKLYGEILRFGINKDLKSHSSSFPFDLNLFKEFYEYLANVNNWCVFQGISNKNNLTERNPWFLTQESKPVKIKLENNYTSDVDKKRKIFKWITDKNSSGVPYTFHIKNPGLNKSKISNAAISAGKNIQIIHKKFDYGAYTAIENDKNEINIEIEFSADFPLNGNAKQNFYSFLYKKFIFDSEKNPIKDLIVTFDTFKVNIHSKSNEELLYVVQKLKSFLDEPIEMNKINNFDSEMNKIYNRFLNLNPLQQSYKIIGSIAKTDDLSSFNCKTPRYKPWYYVDITLFGQNVELYAEKCYNLIKSEEKPKLKMISRNENIKMEMLDTREETFMCFAFDLGKNVNGRQYGMGLILKAIYSGRVFELLREKYQLSYESVVTTEIVKERAFLVVTITSTSSKEKIIGTLKNEFLKYSEVINSVEDNFFESIKEETKYEIESLFSNVESMESLVDLAKKLGIYSFNCKELLKKTLKSITKKDLKELFLENFDPLILIEEKKPKEN